MIAIVIVTAVALFTVSPARAVLGGISDSEKEDFHSRQIFARIHSYSESGKFTDAQAIAELHALALRHSGYLNLMRFRGESLDRPEPEILNNLEFLSRLILRNSESRLPTTDEFEAFFYGSRAYQENLGSTFLSENSEERLLNLMGSVEFFTKSQAMHSVIRLSESGKVNDALLLALLNSAQAKPKAFWRALGRNLNSWLRRLPRHQLLLIANLKFSDKPYLDKPEEFLINVVDHARLISEGVALVPVAPSTKLIDRVFKSCERYLWK